MTRTDSFTWTYRVGEHHVSVRDADRADALPAALHVIDAIVDALSKDPS